MIIRIIVFIIWHESFQINSVPVHIQISYARKVEQKEEPGTLRVDYKPVSLKHPLSLPLSLSHIQYIQKQNLKRLTDRSLVQGDPIRRNSSRAPFFLYQPMNWILFLSFFHSFFYASKRTVRSTFTVTQRIEEEEEDLGNE